MGSDHEVVTEADSDVRGVHVGCDLGVVGGFGEMQLAGEDSCGGVGGFYRGVEEVAD